MTTDWLMVWLQMEQALFCWTGAAMLLFVGVILPRWAMKRRVQRDARWALEEVQRLSR